MATDQDFLGQGWAFPPQWDEQGNKLRMVSGLDDINQSLLILFTTEIGERVMQPQYGTALRSMLFEDLNEHFRSYIQLVLTRSLSLFEVRIRPVRWEFSADNTLEGRYLIHLEYVVRSTNQRANFVFPFYLNK